MGLKGKIFKFMSDILKDGSYYKLYTQAKSTSACGLPKGFFENRVHILFEIAPFHFISFRDFWFDRSYFMDEIYPNNIILWY